MPQVVPDSFVLVGSRTEGGTCYLRQSGADGDSWIAFDVGPDGELINPRVIFGQGSRGWRGLPEVA